MALRRTTKPTHDAPVENSCWIESYRLREVASLILTGFALMLFLAFFSYKPAAGETEAVKNWVGPIGDVASIYAFFAVGAVCFLIPVVLLWWAVQIVTTGRQFRIRNILALSMFMVSAACLVDCQTMFFQDWIERYSLPESTGGIVGKRVGSDFAVRFFGPGGGFIMMSVIAILTLIVVTGIHPFRFARFLGSKIGGFFNRVDWERKWALWSGVTPKESIYPIQRALPSSAIPVEPFIADELVDDDDDYPEIEAEVREVVERLLEDIDAEESGVPKTQRVRKIIDASQRRHHTVSPSISGESANMPLFAVTTHHESYQLPSLDLLSHAPETGPVGDDDEALIQIQNHIVGTLNSFKVEVEPGDITKGPTVTRYEVYPSPGLRVNKITALKDDIARATMAERVNILAPIPGKDTVGIEIANSNRITVALRELLESDVFRRSKAKLPLVLGKDVYGRTVVGDLARMPHLLVAGATGSGKSVCINSIIASLLYRFTPDELKFIMIDPKVVEMQLYNALPHMVVPVVTEPKNVIMALRWVIKEMDSRYTLFAKKGVRSFDGYNTVRAREVRGQAAADRKAIQPNLPNVETGEDFLTNGEEIDVSSKDNELPEKLPYIVVIIDELADLMQTAPADVETGIARIAQKARAAGIHLIIATQTPRADVVTGIIKANIPCRIAFQVSSKTDSRIILDENGAENLIGKGDMLYLPPGSAQLIRAQGALITDDEAQSIVDACAANGGPKFAEGGGDAVEFDFGLKEESEECEVSAADEEVISRCLEVIFTEKKASTSMLQRKLRLGYTRAARMIDILESRGIIGPGVGAKPREILVDIPSEPSHIDE